MRRNLAAASALLLALVLLAAWWLWPGADRPVPPAPTVSKPTPRPGPRLYALRNAAHPAPPEPEPGQDEENADPPTQLERESAFALVRSADRAVGAGWKTCVEPTLPEGGWELPPLVLNLVVQDGQVVDLELMSPIDLDPELLACFADAAWSVDYPEDPFHRGETRIQRTMGLKK